MKTTVVWRDVRHEASQLASDKKGVPPQTEYTTWRDVVVVI
jgi:hypothetical protein